MSPFDSKSQNLQMSANIFFCASSYSFRNKTILNYWRWERWRKSSRTIFENVFSKLVNNVELLQWISNILHVDEWRWHIYTQRIPTRTITHTHTHTYTHTHTHTHTHAHAYIHKKGVTLHILVSSISSEGVVYHYSDVSPDGATAPVRVTNFVNWCVACVLI